MWVFIMKSTKMKWFICLGFIILQYKWYHVVFNVIVHKYGKRPSRSNELNLALVSMQLQDNAQQKNISEILRKELEQFSLSNCF
jgi:hypothetical protein